MTGWRVGFSGVQRLRSYKLGPMAQASPYAQLPLIPILMVMPLSRQIFFDGPVYLNISEFQGITKGTHFLFSSVSLHILNVHVR